MFKCNADDDNFFYANNKLYDLIDSSDNRTAGRMFAKSTSNVLRF